MLIIFFRHGVAEESGHGVRGKDEDRRLVKQGVRETKWVADALNALKIRPTVTLTSPLVRAVETAEAALSRFRKADTPILAKSLTPDGDWAKVMREVKQNAKSKDTVLLVGHQPSLGHHVMKALGAVPREEFGFPKSGCIVLQWKDAGISGPGELLLAMSPGVARKIRKRMKRG